MTKKEAIEILEDLKGYFSDNQGRDYDEAFRMAIEALSAEYKHCWDCKHYEPKYDVCHAPEVLKQVTSKLKNPCDSLLKADSEDAKEHKSKLDDDLISRADAIEAVESLPNTPNGFSDTYDKACIIGLIEALPSAEDVSRNDYKETDGVITIEKQNAMDVEEIKYIIIRSPNYTRYFYNEPLHDMVDVVRCKDCKHQDECEEVVLFEVNDGEVVGHRLHWCSYGERKGGEEDD